MIAGVSVGNGGGFEEKVMNDLLISIRTQIEFKSKNLNK